MSEVRGKVKITSTVCGEYWGLTGTIGPERCTTGLRRNRDGVIEEIAIEPTCIIVFDDNDDYRERYRARGAVGLTRFLSLPESDIQFEQAG